MERTGLNSPSRRTALMTLADLTLLAACGGGSGFPIGPAKGLSADRPVLQKDDYGVFGSPWGAAGAAWPEQLFWNNYLSRYRNELPSMRAGAAGIESSKRAPVLGCVGWGYEYKSATGGDPANYAAIPDRSKDEAWKQWGAWMSAHQKYASTDWYGKTEPGYFTPLMPMDAGDWPADWNAPAGWVAPAGWSNGKPGATISYGQWLGVRLAQLCLEVGCRGIYCADYVVGLEWGDAIDYNSRVVDSFAAWAKVTVPAGSVTARADYVQENYKALWWDFKCTRFAEFYGAVAKNLIANGKVPLVGGQISGYPMLTRWLGNDFRTYTQGSDGLPGKYWFFNVELQCDSLRLPSDYWLSSLCMGTTASREPDMQLGAQMDAKGGQGEFDRSISNAGKDADWGAKHISHQWLSVGWTHVVGRNGAVRRAPMSFMRSYWDDGATPQAEFDLILAHIPRHPFGPAFYYSVAIERSYEVNNGKTSNAHWICIEKMLREVLPLDSRYRRGNARGLCLGYHVSDVGVSKLSPVDYPSAWIVYDSDRLPETERRTLEAIAPIYDIDASRTDGDGQLAARLLALGPVHVAQASNQCLNCQAFVDQNGSVIVMISNTLETTGSGSLVFANVSNGSFHYTALRGAANGLFTIAGNSGSMPVSVPARDVIVFEIPGLKWIGH